MGIRKVPFVEGEYYHIYNRGNSKQKIFLDKEDYNRFIKLLYLCNSSKNLNFRDNIKDKKIEALNFERGDQIIAIGVWVLMPNHFHLCLSIPKGRTFGNGERENRISLFVKKVCTSYTMYFNRKYNRSGSLFEGKFKSQYVVDDKYLKYLFSYIHLNPIKIIQKDWKEKGINSKEEALGFLNNYKYSSYLDYIGISRAESKILNKKSFPGYFPTPENINKEIFEWLSYKDNI
ncbi:MAG: transposase [Candidatus Paceibacterota bacterium]